MTERDEFGEELADFVRRVAELRTARSLPPEERPSALDASLFELQYAADELWPRYERLVRGDAAPDSALSVSAVADRQERQLLRSLFQRLPLAVALVDRDTVVRRMNFAATGLTGVRAGYATGRPLASLLGPGDRAAFRSQTAAVARGEGDRGLTVRLQQRPSEPLLATLTALRPPDEPHPAVLVVLQPGTTVGAARARTGTESAGRSLPDLSEATRHAELIDLIDAMASALLRAPAGGRESVLRTAAQVLAGRFADWVVVDLAGGGTLRRIAVLGAPDDVHEDDVRSGGDREILRDGLAAQDPCNCPLVVEAARGASGSLQVSPEDTEGFGRDAAGLPMLVRASVSSLVCVPLSAPADRAAGSPPGPVQGVLTLFRTGNRRAFSMAEGRAVDVMARHTALAAAARSAPADRTGRGRG
ncbi:PAS domain-containing protein [Streptomyces sp. NPDC004111]|uniref:PAS domain-containing protein n=1 Tax=Streptomyces sp. NPDC004111 TaxID=3364690 RepID=UPI0036C6CE43